MSTGVLIFLLIFAVPSSQFQLECVQKYAECAVPVLNRWKDLANCSLAITFIKCITTVSEKCDTHVTPVFKDILTDVEELCPSDDAKKQEWKKAGQCVAKNTDSLKGCARKLTEDSCNEIISMIQCISSTMHDECGAFAGNVIDTIMSPVHFLTTKLCSLAGEIDNTAQCLVNNTQSFLSCKLTGEFNKVGDICSSIDGFTQCLISETREECGLEAESIVQVYMGYVTFAVRLCKNIVFMDSIPLPECYKGVLKCNVDIFNAGEPQCTDVSTYVGCLADATRKCEDEREKGRNPLYLIILEKYKSKFPVYCDKGSSFSKNMEKQGLCIDENTEKVFNPCFEQLQKDGDGIQWFDGAPGTLRVYVNFLHCISGGFGKKCSKEAEDAINELLHPLGDSFDEQCRMLTGERCNSACGLKVATWIFIASLAYLLTRRYE